MTPTRGASSGLLGLGAVRQHRGVLLVVRANAGEERLGPVVLRVGEYIARFAVLDDGPTIHEYDAIRDFAGKSHLVCDDDHRHASSRQSTHDVEYVADQLR